MVVIVANTDSTDSISLFGGMSLMIGGAGIKWKNDPCLQEGNPVFTGAFISFLLLGRFVQLICLAGIEVL